MNRDELKVRDYFGKLKNTNDIETWNLYPYKFDVFIEDILLKRFYHAVLFGRLWYLEFIIKLWTDEIMTMLKVIKENEISSNTKMLINRYFAS